MRDFLYALRSGFGFLTTIPVGISMEGIQKLMGNIYLFPIIGAAIGLILGAAGYIFTQFLPIQLTSILVIISTYILTGFNHLDGLADFGDGLAAHGPRTEKIKAMQDVALGVGGIFFCVLSLLSFYVSLSLIQSLRVNAGVILFSSILLAEVCAKQSMVTASAFAKPIHEGLGALTIKNTTRLDLLASFLFSAFTAGLVLGWTGISALLFSTLSALFLLKISNHSFGGLSGDGIGAANEVGRITALFTAGLLLGGTPWMPW